MLEYLYLRKWDYLLTQTSPFERHCQPELKLLKRPRSHCLLCTSKIIVHLVCKMNWVTANKSSTYYDINYWASSCTNGVSEICKTLQASEFWMQYKQPILSLWNRLWISRNGDQFNYSQNLYWSMTACSLFEDNIKKLLIVSAVYKPVSNS